MPLPSRRAAARPKGPVDDLRSRARALFDAGCTAAQPGPALARAFAAHPLPAGPVRLLALGKAAAAMAEATLAALPQPPRAALAVTNDENARPLPGVEMLTAGHPVPDARGLAAAERVESLLADLGPDETLLALISGGGSALLPAPAAGLTLQDKAEVSRLMLGAGLDITQMNLVRQQLSRLKGGRLLRAAQGAAVRAYVLSDVIGDDLRVIASGPTVAPIGSRAEAAALLHRAGLWERLPDAVAAHLSQPEPALPPLPPAETLLVGSNRMSLDAMVAAAGGAARIVSDALVGDVGTAAAQIAAAAQRAAPGEVLLWGGETTVRVSGDGLGGRNQELALRVAMAMADPPGEWAFLSGGTDGRDGPTDAAGGLVDGGTVARIQAAGLNPGAVLARSDSYHALQAAGDLLMTGGTGTNVADLQILLRR